MTADKAKTGIYYLANDHVIDWLIASLASLRSYNKRVRVVVIPYDDQIRNLVHLSTKYDFELCQDESFTDLDRIGLGLGLERDAFCHVFRKLAVFWGPLERFLFLDSDIILLSNVEQLIDAFAESDAEIVYFDTDLDQVYAPGDFRDRMVQEYGSVGFNSGAFMSLRNVLTLREIERTVCAAIAADADFVDWYDQPLLNYCVDTKRLRKKSVMTLVPGLTHATWAALKIRRERGVFRCADRRYSDFGRRLPFLHWAGFSLGPSMPNRELYLHFRMQGAAPSEQLSLVWNWRILPLLAGVKPKLPKLRVK